MIKTNRLTTLKGIICAVLLVCIASISYGKSPISALPVSGFDPIVFNLEDISGQNGDQVCMDISVESFERVESISFTLNYNPNIVSIVDPVDITNSPFVATELFLVPNNSIGQLRVIWTDPNVIEGDGVTLVDGTTIFTLCFDIVADCGESSDIIINSVGTIEETLQIATDGTLCTLNEINYTPGSVSVTCDDIIISSSKCDVTDTGNGMDGSISFFVAGGSGDYSYSISPAITGGNGSSDEAEIIKIEDVNEGNYIITATDNNTGANTSESVFISQNFALDLTLDAVDPYCWNRPRGTVTANAESGGFPANIISYEWSNFQFTQTIDQLPSGTYTVTVTDNFGCSAIETTTLFVDTLRVYAELIDSASCEGNNDAVVKIWAEGGTPFPGNPPQYEYETSEDDEQTDTLILNNVGVGLFEYQAIDAAIPFCGSEIEFLDIPFKGNEISIEIDSTDITCFGANDGTVTITATGASNFGFRIRDSDNNLVPGGSFPNVRTAENLEPGCYTVTVEESVNGCIVEGSFCINEPDPLLFTVDNVVDPGCIGGDGSISLNTSGGTMPYTYLWQDNIMTEDRTNLGSGMYSVTITDGSGCQDSLMFDLPDGSDIDIEAIVVDAISCAQDEDGIVEVTVATGGTFTYNWENALGEFISDQAIVMDLGSGTYFVTVTDAATGGCSAMDDIVLAPASLVAVTANYQEPTCAGTPNGTISLTPALGVTPFTYMWEDGTPIQILAGVAEGTYDVTVADANGCELDTFFTLTAADTINIDVTNIITVDCYGDNSGAATATASGGPTGSGLYTYIWSNDPTSFSEGISDDQTGLSAGTNWVIAGDLECSSDTIFFDVPTIDSISIDANLTTIVEPSCYLDCDGLVTVVASGGNPDSYSYLWTADNTIGDTHTDLCAGTYEIEITDANGCSVIRSVTLTQPDSLSLTIDPTSSSVLGCDMGTGQISVIATGGTESYTYTWTDAVSDNNTASDLGTGTYEIMVTDANGCIASTSTNLTAPTPLNVVVATPDPVECFGDLTCITIESVTGGVGNDYTFTINNGGFRYPVDSCVVVFANDYLITVIDSSGTCSDITNISIDQPAEISVDAGEDIEVTLGLPSDPITPSVISTDPIMDVLWTPMDSIECLDAECLDIITFPLLDTEYTVTVFDENGCSASDDLLVRVSARRNVFIPNIFTPDGDGVNDFFNLTLGAGATSVSYLSIFDRWGNQVFTKDTEFIPEIGSANGWDGTYGGNFVNPGVYVYVAQVNFIDGRVLDYTGDITVIR